MPEKIHKALINVALVCVCAVLLITTAAIAWEVTVTGSELALQTLDKFGYLALGAVIAVVGARANR